MAEVKQYVDIMLESLHKKSGLLDQIIESSIKLEKTAAKTEMDMDCFKEILDEKDGYVSQINQLDMGFQDLFDKVKEEIYNNRDGYRQQILAMQQQIRDITDKVVQIQELEAKNRLAIEGQFGRMRREIRKSKQGMNVAQGYYNSMAKMNVVDAQFLDKRN